MIALLVNMLKSSCGAITWVGNALCVAQGCSDMQFSWWPGPNHDCMCKFHALTWFAHRSGNASYTDWVAGSYQAALSALCLVGLVCHVATRGARVCLSMVGNICPRGQLTACFWVKALPARLSRVSRAATFVARLELEVFINIHLKRISNFYEYPS